MSIASDTPRTDFEESHQTQRYGCYMVKSEFARGLEREIYALKAVLQRIVDNGGIGPDDMFDDAREVLKLT
jgi:hypothetical protein